MDYIHNFFQKIIISQIINLAESILNITYIIFSSFFLNYYFSLKYFK